MPKRKEPTIADLLKEIKALREEVAALKVEMAGRYWYQPMGWQRWEKPLDPMNPVYWITTTGDTLPRHPPVICQNTAGAVNV